MCLLHRCSKTDQHFISVMTGPVFQQLRTRPSPYTAFHSPSSTCRKFQSGTAAGVRPSACNDERIHQAECIFPTSPWISSTALFQRFLGPLCLSTTHGRALSTTTAR